MYFLGFRGNIDGNQPFGAQYPQIRGTGFDPQPVSVANSNEISNLVGPPQNRIFRNAANPTSQTARPINSDIPNVPFVPPSYPAGHYDHHEHGYSFQTINGQYVNTGKRKKRETKAEKINFNDSVLA